MVLIFKEKQQISRHENKTLNFYKVKHTKCIVKSSDEKDIQNTPDIRFIFIIDRCFYKSNQR